MFNLIFIICILIFEGQIWAINSQQFDFEHMQNIMQKWWNEIH